MDYGRIVPKLTFAPDGKTLAVLYGGDQGRDPAAAGLQGGVRLWDLENGKVIRSLRGHKHLALSVAFSPDGSQVATGGDQNDNSLRLWDQRTGRLLWVSATGGGVFGIAFSPDGKLMATGRSDGRLVLWDAATGKEVRSFVEAGARSGQPAFSPDGRLLLGVESVDKGGQPVTQVELWDVRTGKLLRTWPDVLGSAAFAPDGHTVSILGKGGVIWLWDLRQAEGPVAERPAVTDDGFRPLVDQLLQGKRNDAQVVEALFLATLGRFPAEAEAKLPLEHLASKQQSRREAIEGILHALKHSKGYFSRLDALQRTDPRKRP
jgi:WD40 repeat protein